MQAIVKNIQIITNEASFVNNLLPDGNFEIKPDITRKIDKLKNSENKYALTMQVIIKNEPENRFPFDLRVRITGIFEFEAISNEKDINQFLKLQGVQMVFPYLRSMVSNLTSTVLMPSIMLPIINPLDFNDDDKQDA